MVIGSAPSGGLTSGKDGMEGGGIRLPSTLWPERVPSALWFRAASRSAESLMV